MSRVLLVLASMLPVLAACADETADTTTGPPDVAPVTPVERPEPDTSAVASDTVQVTLVDFEIQMPDTLDAGATVFNITSAGSVEHGFEVEGQGIEEELDPHLQPGQRGALRVDLVPGSYRVYCPVGDHADARGMELTLTVR